MLNRIIIFLSHGEPWKTFRTKVQKPILQLHTVKKYVEPIEAVTNDFIQRQAFA